MFWFLQSRAVKADIQSNLLRISALEDQIVALQEKLEKHEAYIHSDAFHELLASGIFDEEKFDDLAQEAVERCVSNAELKVRF
jgi:hypothetical protein